VPEENVIASFGDILAGQNFVTEICQQGFGRCSQSANCDYRLYVKKTWSCNVLMDVLTWRSAGEMFSL